MRYVAGDGHFEMNCPYEWRPDDHLCQQQSLRDPNDR
jgi:hypothetical protein